MPSRQLFNLFVAASSLEWVSICAATVRHIALVKLGMAAGGSAADYSL